MISLEVEGFTREMFVGAKDFLPLWKNKYPPAQPGVLRLLPPQKGLIAIGESQNPRTVNVGVKHIA